MHPSSTPVSTHTHTHCDAQLRQKVSGYGAKVPLGVIGVVASGMDVVAWWRLGHPWWIAGGEGVTFGRAPDELTLLWGLILGTSINKKTYYVCNVVIINPGVANSS